MILLAADMAEKIDLGPLLSPVTAARAAVASAQPVSPSGLSKADYLISIRGIVQYFRQYQNENGQIIDPYANKEIQYSTPCFALSCATLVAAGQHQDLLLPASRALTCSLQQLANGNAADKHGDFFTFPAVQAYHLLKNLVEEQVRVEWDWLLRAIDPYKAYQNHSRNDPTQDVEFQKKYSAGKLNNWNVVNVAGEFLRWRGGFVPDLAYVEEHLEKQLANLSPEGLYVDPHGPTAYDAFPRLFLCAMLEWGYEGRHRHVLEPAMERAAWASLLMQSPAGELPVGGRSAQHAWNEAQLSLIFEIFARRKRREGDAQAAGMFKRAARLALRALQRWRRPSGELCIVKNHLDPALRHGFEAYSFHSQYNLLAASMLASAYAFADEEVTERPAPCEVGGFLLQVPALHKIFANAAGLYLEIDSCAEAKYESTGLVRLHKRGVEPLLLSGVPPAGDLPAAVGIGWREAVGGAWQELAAYTEGRISHCALQPEPDCSLERLRFTVRYELESGRAVHEAYEVTGERVRVRAWTSPAAEQLRVRFPALVSDGSARADIDITRPGEARLCLGGSSLTLRVEEPQGVRFQATGVEVASRNGFVQLLQAELPAGAAAVTYSLWPAPASQ